MTKSTAPESISIYYVLHSLVAKSLKVAALANKTRVRTYTGSLEDVKNVLAYTARKGWTTKNGATVSLTESGLRMLRSRKVWA